MARSRNGSLLGAAAVSQKREQRQEIQAAQLEAARVERERVKAALGDAMSDLKTLDPLGWESWFDSDAVPEGPYAVILPVILARVEILKSNQSQ